MLAGRVFIVAGSGSKLGQIADALVAADAFVAVVGSAPVSSEVAAHLAERERAYAREMSHVAPPWVLWDDSASQHSSVVEVRTHDSVGLLYRLTRALADLGLDVRSARMSTLGAEVVDAFYVVDGDGRPIDDAGRRTVVEQALLTACQPAS